MTKHYVDDAGRYLGGWDGGRAKNGTERTHPDVPARAVEVPTAPDDVRQTWNGSAWSDVPGPNYREQRAVDYRDRMGAEPGDFIKTIGDVLDDVLGQYEAAIAANEITPTAEMTALLATRRLIKQRFPKP